MTTHSDTWNPNAHEFEEDVDDASMCVCGIPDLTHDSAMAQFAAPAGLPLHESADRDADNVPSDRVRAYAEALHREHPDARMSCPGCRRQARAVMAVADREQAELWTEIERLRAEHKAWQETSRSVSATVAHHWRETKDVLAKAEANLTALRIDLAHAERMASDIEDRAEKAEAIIARVEALAGEYWWASAVPTPLLRAALRGPEPTEATSNEDAPGLDVRADAPTPVGAEPTEECIDDSDICGRCDRRHAAQECSEQSAAEWTAAHLSNPEPTDAP